MADPNVIPNAVKNFSNASSGLENAYKLHHTNLIHAFNDVVADNTKLVDDNIKSKDANQSLNARLQEVMRVLSATEQQRIALQTVLNAEKESHGKTKEESLGLKDKNAGLEKLLEESEDATRFILEQKEQTVQRNEDLKRELKEAKDREHSISATNKLLDSQKGRHESQIKDLEAEIERLQDVSGTLPAEKERIEREYANRGLELAGLNESLNSAKKSLRRLQTKTRHQHATIEWAAHTCHFAYDKQDYDEAPSEEDFSNSFAVSEEEYANNVIIYQLATLLHDVKKRFREGSKRHQAEKADLQKSVDEQCEEKLTARSVLRKTSELLRSKKKQVDSLSSRIQAAEKAHSAAKRAQSDAEKAHNEAETALRRGLQHKDNEIKLLSDRAQAAGRKKSDAEGLLARLRSEWAQTLKDEQVKARDAEKALKMSQDSKMQETRALKDSQAKLEAKDKIIATHRDETRKAETQVQPLEGELKQAKSKLETLEAERRQAEEDISILQEDLKQHQTALDEMQQRQAGFFQTVKTLQSKRSHEQAMEGSSSTGGRKDSHQEDNHSSSGRDDELEQHHSTSHSNAATKLSNSISMNLRAAAANRSTGPSFVHQAQPLTPSRNATPAGSSVTRSTSSVTLRNSISASKEGSAPIPAQPGKPLNAPTGPKRKYSGQTPLSEKRHRYSLSRHS